MDMDQGGTQPVTLLSLGSLFLRRFRVVRIDLLAVCAASDGYREITRGGRL